MDETDVRLAQLTRAWEKARAQRERRERLARGMANGLLSAKARDAPLEAIAANADAYAKTACVLADALIAVLDSDEQDMIEMQAQLADADDGK